MYLMAVLSTFKIRWCSKSAYTSTLQGLFRLKNCYLNIRLQVTFVHIFRFFDTNIGHKIHESYRDIANELVYPVMRFVLTDKISEADAASKADVVILTTWQSKTAPNRFITWTNFKCCVPAKRAECRGVQSSRRH